MEKIYFHYRVHPGDLLRNTDVVKMPNPDNDLEDFLVSFLSNYQSDNRIAYLDDLYKLSSNEFSSELERLDFINQVGIKTEAEIKEEINLVVSQLKAEAYKNFYNLILSNKIEIVSSNEK